MSSVKRSPPRAFRVFIFDGMMSGMPTGEWLWKRNTRFVGAANTLSNNFTMYDIGRFPAVVIGGSTHIVGELWDVDADTFADLNRLKGYTDQGGGHYDRLLLSTFEGPMAYMFVFTRDFEEMYKGRIEIESGDWRAHSQFRRLAHPETVPIVPPSDATTDSFLETTRRP